MILKRSSVMTMNRSVRENCGDQNIAHIPRLILNKNGGVLFPFFSPAHAGSLGAQLVPPFGVISLDSVSQRASERKRKK